MKIAIKTSNYHLSFINEMIADNLPAEQKGFKKEDKSLFYLMNEIAAKLLKKAIDKKGTSKPFTITLKYYEAFTLHKFILIYMDYEEGEKKRVTREILGTINQKLT
jgi:methyltransferase-like protein